MCIRESHGTVLEFFRLHTHCCCTPSSFTYGVKINIKEIFILFYLISFIPQRLFYILPDVIYPTKIVLYFTWCHLSNKDWFIFYLISFIQQRLVHILPDVIYPTKIGSYFTWCHLSNKDWFIFYLISFIQQRLFHILPDVIYPTKIVSYFTWCHL